MDKIIDNNKIYLNEEPEQVINFKIVTCSGSFQCGLFFL